MFCIAYGCDNHQRRSKFPSSAVKEACPIRTGENFVNCVNASLSYHRQIVAREDEAGRSTHL